MDHYKKLQQQIVIRLFGLMVWLALLASGLTWLATSLLQSPIWLGVGLVVAGSLVISGCLALLAGSWLLAPVHSLWQAILHVSPSSHPVTAPDLDNIKLGRELVTSLATQVYELARRDNATAPTANHTDRIVQATNLINNLPSPIFVCNKQRLVTYANTAALDYAKVSSSELLGKELFDNLHLEFGSDLTLEKWMDTCQSSKIQERNTWERVRVLLADQTEPLQCDLTAFYNRDNPSGTEFIIHLFDRTANYQQDDRSLGFVALAVHELRTPLTMLRGYIEVFEEEVTDKLDDELKGFMYKMQVAAEQLTGFVNNILNVARIEQDQLELVLVKEDWASILKHIIEDNQLRARVHDKTINLTVADNLPSVAVDKVSIYEVVSNLLDNAIKYSADSRNIEVNSKLAKDGTIVTTVTDHGVGISTSILPNLFEKFYRNHRTRSSIGGTGLGLYLTKTIVTAHGGQVWAQSKEGEGSTFGFSLQPYDSVAASLPGQKPDITRAAHGWVKNHSLYRR